MGKKEWCYILESEFQKKVIEEVKERLPGSIVLKNDPNYIQGIPDLIILYKSTWGCLEVKKSKNATQRPNQDYYISLMYAMSFASFIFPENKEEVLDELERTLRA